MKLNEIVIGQSYITYVSGAKVTVIVIGKTESAFSKRTQFRVKRFDNGKELSKSRSPAALHLPAAACQRCGGWTNYGGMNQHFSATEPVHGRIGCTCHGSIGKTNYAERYCNELNERTGIAALAEIQHVKD